MCKCICALVVGFIFIGVFTGHSQNGNELSFTCRALPWYKYRKDGKPGREIMLEITKGKLTGKVSVTVVCNDREETTELAVNESARKIPVLLPAGVGVTSTEVTVTLNTNNSSNMCKVMVPANKQWTVYIYPHAHV